MRKSKYLILGSLYFKFNENLSEIDEVKKYFDTQNILDLLRFDELPIIKENQFRCLSINFVYFSNNIKYLKDYSFKDNKIKYINISNCNLLQVIDQYALTNNFITILDLSNCISINIIKSFSFYSCNIKILKMKFTNIENIEDSAFKNNNILNLDLIQCKQLSHIEDNAFANNPLKNIKIPDNIIVFFDLSIQLYYANIYDIKDKWNKFSLYYRQNIFRSGNYKYEDNEWIWYPL